MWLLYFLFWAAVRANAERPLYKKIGDEAVLTPESVENPITSIVWRHGSDITMEWYGNETLSNQQFRDRGSLNISTGALTITGLTRDDSSIYTAEINGKETSKTELLVISPVPKPNISVSCDAEMTYCVFTCEGNITGAEPVTYWFAASDMVWLSTNQQHNITKEETEQWFSCSFVNPVSVKISEEIFNPLITRGYWRFIGLITLFIVVVCIIIIVIYLIHRKVSSSKKRCDDGL